ncbi:MAG: helix-turn-helix domain-containing protein [Calditrichaeota bacterium]|nr:MAG: helix-turn-helix domain-containing protein [Calditrichota bacterium]MBL1204916.1 helix-turn-helix domain-containing protein [Calditrichota bacterium]NOG44745.1 PTS transporter subunit EIIA [Calditrichota bacterium]
MKDKFGKYMSQKEVANLLGLPEVTVQRWIHQGKIPTKILNKKTVLKHSEIITWAKAHDLDIKQNKTSKETASNNTFLLSSALEKGGIFYNIEAQDVYSAFENSLTKLSFLMNEDKKNILNGLINREELASTGIGNGIAIPHTRSRIQLNLDSAHIPVIFLKEPIPFNAIDSHPVFVLFMIFTTDVKEHLKMLSKLSFVLQQDKIMNILNERNTGLDLIDEIKEVENEQV